MWKPKDSRSYIRKAATYAWWNARAEAGEHQKQPHQQQCQPHGMGYEPSISKIKNGQLAVSYPLLTPLKVDWSWGSPFTPFSWRYRLFYSPFWINIYLETSVAILWTKAMEWLSLVGVPIQGNNDDCSILRGWDRRAVSVGSVTTCATDGAWTDRETPTDRHPSRAPRRTSQLEIPLFWRKPRLLVCSTYHSVVLFLALGTNNIREYLPTLASSNNRCSKTYLLLVGGVMAEAL